MRAAIAALFAATAFAGVGSNPAPVQLVRPATAPLSAMATLGRFVFFDPSVSGSGRVSCASCHSPQHAYGPPADAPLVRGSRAVPSLMYLERQPVFSIGPDDPETEGSARPAGSTSAHSLVPQGGLFWDGRADTLQDQALGPLLNPAEMNGGSVQRVAAALRRAPYAARFAQLFGPAVFERPAFAVAEALFAVARYEFEAPAFHPYTSKFDYWLEGKARFTPAEARGYALFNDPARANCAACHLDRPTATGLPPLLTDEQYEALGVPRAATAVAGREDLGLCGPLRTDLKRQTAYCGMFLTPTLRNVAVRHAFFHNGAYHTLRQVLDFYDYRETQPQRIYPRRRDGSIAKYDDLPPADRRNVDVADAPFDRRAGQPPPLSAPEERDIIAFLRTLTDGYRRSGDSRPPTNRLPG